MHTTNHDLSQGCDSVFGKSIHPWMKPLNNPPYYSMRISSKTHYSLGGLMIDPQTHVLNQDGKILPGLFAVGEVTGLTHGANRLGSCSVTECLVMGRIAGRQVLNP
jgi:succinate dehydrogenase/fumarate reductase flavoprotein subunit